jgi:hypothetical protein
LSAPAPKALVPTSPTAKPADTTPPVNPELKAENDRRAAEAKANESARIAQLTRDQKRAEEVEARRLEITRLLTDRDSKITHTERAGLTDELRRLVAGQVSQQEREQMLETVSIHEWRDRFGVRNEVQPHLQELWDDDAEASVLESCSFDGCTPSQVQTIMSWYAAKFNALGGQVENLTPELEVEFRSVAKRAGISERLTEALIAFERERVEG